MFPFVPFPSINSKVLPFMYMLNSNSYIHNLLYKYITIFCISISLSLSYELTLITFSITCVYVMVVNSYNTSQENVDSILNKGCYEFQELTMITFSMTCVYVMVVNSYNTSLENVDSILNKGCYEFQSVTVFTKLRY
jgi:uncharacterized membrane protein (DUF485 family)